MITGVVAEKRATIVNPLHPRDPALAAIFGGYTSSSGEVVTAETAMTEESFMAGVEWYCKMIASLPFPLYRRIDEGREPARDHWLYRRLHDRWNWVMTSYEARKLIVNHLFLRGNYYVLIRPSRRMPPFELMPLSPDRMRAFWGETDADEPYYEYTLPKGGTVRLRWGEVWHGTLMPGDGLTGKSIIDHAKDAIGAVMATNKYGARVLNNGGSPSGIVISKKKLSPAAKKQMAEDWRDAHVGVQNAGRVAIFDEDMDFKPVALTNEQLQWLDTQKFGVVRMARILGVQPHKLGALERATWGNIEEQNIEAVTDALRPVCVSIEQTVARDLLLERELDTLYAELNLEGLLRGNFLTRQQGLQIMRQNGIIDGNQWAARENLNSFAGGDVRIVPLNMIDLTDVHGRLEAGQPANAIRERRSTGETQALELLLRLRRAHHPMIADAARRQLRREADNVDRAFRRHVQDRALTDFLAWLDSYYTQQRGDLLAGMGAALGSYCETIAAAAASLTGGAAPEIDAFIAAYAGAFAARSIAESRGAVVRLVTELQPEQMLAACDELLRDWRTARPGRIATRETVQAGNAAARHTWQAAGVQNIRWLKGGDCPQCDELSGRITPIAADFVEGFAHGPLHEGCSCAILPA
jgi:HK97 family phage portal protein